MVSRTLDKPIWHNTTIIRDDVVGAVRALKASAGKTLVTDGSSQLVHALIEADLVDELYLHVYRWRSAAARECSRRLALTVGSRRRRRHPPRPASSVCIPRAPRSTLRHRDSRGLVARWPDQSGLVA